ncbi:unnamed protein product, partial [Hapterophycus canaliculatus]
EPSSRRRRLWGRQCRSPVWRLSPFWVSADALRTLGYRRFQKLNCRTRFTEAVKPRRVKVVLLSFCCPITAHDDGFLIDGFFWKARTVRGRAGRVGMKMRVCFLLGGHAIHF